MKFRSKKGQGGVSLIGLIVGLAVIGGIAVLGLKVFPTVNEYYAIRRAVNSVKTAGTSPNDIRMAFNRQAEVGYISAIAGKDLDIVPAPNGGFDVSFEYQKVIHLFGPANLLLDYRGSTSPFGSAEQKANQ